MGISNNSPTMSYIHISGISVVWNNETYMVQDFATNKKYIYWNADFPHQLNASNVMPSRSAKQYLVIVNDNGMHTLVPPTSDDFSISFEGNSNQAIKDRIFGLYNKSDEFEKQFVAVEQDIDGIKSIVGTTEGTTEGTLIDRMSKVEQRADKIDLSVEQISKTYNDDKETNQLRENLNSSVIKLNSALGVLKNELTDYFKDNEISSEEQIKIKAQLGILKSEKTTLEGYVDTVKLIAENNNQTQDVVAIESAKKSLQIAHDNLHNNITNAVIDNIITPTENTIIIDSFAKYNLRINELKNTCDDIIILGVGGVITEELANISIKSNEIKLSVSKVESDFKNDMSLQKLELEGQIKDVNNALGSFEETVNTTFKDGIIDEAEKSLLQEKINLIDKEKVDIDLRYNSVIQDLNLSKEVKTELTSKYNEYCNNHNKLKERINSVISDNIINDAEKLEINTLFKTYSNALASFSALMNKAIENISFNASKYELEEAKKELNNSINGVKDSIEGIDKVLDGTFEDNILDEVERENIKQNLQNLSKEKLDIDKIYTNLYNNAYLLGQDKVNLKNSYDNYISKYNNVVKVSNDILEKEDLVNNVDKANMDSAIANHNETLALFHVQANKSIDIIAANRVNGAKNEINEDIESLKGDINGLNDYIDESFRDGVLSDAEKSAIKQNLKTLETNKSNIDKQYSTVYNNTSLIGSAKTELKSAYDNYVLKYNSLVTVINNILNKDDLLVESDSTAINNSFKEHNSAMSTYSEKINKAIDSIALKNIESAKNELSKEIGELEGSLVDLEDTMNGAFKDGILSESEKQSINQHLLTVSSKKTDIDKRYATLSSNAYLEGTAKTNLTTAYNNYIKAYNSLVTVINNILEKEGLIDSVDKNNLDNAFKEHNNKLGLYSTADLNALDYIATKKAESESAKVDKKYADIILDPETGILSKVEHFNKQINGEGGISERLQSAEEQISEDSITQTVKNMQFIKDMDGKITTQEESLSKIDQRVDKIDLSVSKKVDSNGIISAINLSPESIKISSSKINITGFVTFTDLSTPGSTTISGSNITTGYVKGSRIDAKNLTVQTDSGINTLMIDSSGQVELRPKSMTVNTDNKITFLATNNYRNMLLYGGQVCVYNNTNDSFMATIGHVLRSSNSTYKGVGILAGKGCNTFFIGRDSTWGDILTNRSPNPLGSLFINFESITTQTDGVKGIHLRDITYTNSDLIAIGDTRPNISGFNSIQATSGVFDNWKCAYNEATVMRYDANTNMINLGKNLNVNGFSISGAARVESPKVYMDSLYALNGNYGKQLIRTNGWDMFNGVNWDWQGYNILSANLIGCSVSYSLLNTINQSVDVESSKIKLACEDISKIDEDGEVIFDISDMLHLLYDRITKLEEENKELRNLI